MIRTWNETEIGTIAPLAAAELVKGEALLYEAIASAQYAALPKERWRKILSNNDISHDQRLTDAVFSCVSKLQEPRTRTRTPSHNGSPTYNNGHIRWTAQEHEAVAQAAAANVRNGQDLLTAVLHAQEDLLPCGRRRNIKSEVAIGAALRAQIKTLVDLPRTAPLGWTAQPLEQIVVAEPQAEPKPQAEPPPDPHDWMQRIEARLDSLEFICLQMHDMLERLLGPKPLAAASSASIRKAKVILSGLLKEHFDAVSQTWAEFFNLSFVHPDHGGSVSLDRLKAADYVIICTKQPHTGVQRIRGAVSRDKTVLVSSPVTDVCKALEALFSKDVQAQH